MLAVRHLVKKFSSGETEVTAVDDVTFDVADGQFAAIVGRSGSGKSTLLALLGGLDKPTSGHVRVADRTITNESDHDLIQYRRDTVGFVFQNYNLIPNLSALENVMLPMEYVGMRTNDQRARAQALLDQVGVSGTKQRRQPGRLSGGEQQRVAIARALANRPKLILADEPTGNLDTETGSLIFGLLHDLARSEHTTIVAVTHDLSIAGRTDVTFELRDGRLVGPELGMEPTQVRSAAPDQRRPIDETSRESCDICGFVWSLGIDEAIGEVSGLPGRFRVLLDGSADSGRAPGDLSPTECLGYSIDVIRLGTDRLWTLRLDPESPIPGWDQPLSVDRARYVKLTRQVAEPALVAAITTWREAAEAIPRPAPGGRPAPRGLTTTVDIVRRTAHDSRHHLPTVTQADISDPMTSKPSG